MGSLNKYTIGLIIALTIFLRGVSFAGMTENPHNKMECGKCHAEEVDFSRALNNPKFVEKDVVAMCLKCHSDIISVHHPQRVQVIVEVPDYLPVGEGNFITCSTCHDIHIKEVSNHLLRSLSIGNYTSRIEICYECHRDDFRKISPHNSEDEGMSCLMCHRDTPSIRDTSKTVSLVSENIEKMCNFCHNIAVNEHPLNVDTTIEISEKLPRSKDGKVICVTCHEPHGSISTINFLREQYVTDLEFGKYENPHTIREYFNCLKCHVDINSTKLKKQEQLDCKYKNDFILLCYNCHGTDEETCHPINAALKEGMTLPKGFELNKDDLISCVTCHNPDCSGDSDNIRYRNLNDIKESNCHDCHDFGPEKSTNPHLGKDDTLSCFICHKKGEKIESFGMSQKFVCLKCHKYKPHPSSVDHLKPLRSTMALIPGMKLDRKGKIKCSTCHDPHIIGNKNSKLRSFENITICEGCHQL